MAEIRHLKTAIFRPVFEQVFGATCQKEVR